jgi:DNA-binding transcriptional ArsR family regulator
MFGNTKIGPTSPGAKGIMLRKVIIEIPRSKITDFPGHEMLDSWRIVQGFKSDKGGFAGICQIKLRPLTRNPLELTRHLDITKLQILTKLDDGSLIAYVSGKPDSRWNEIDSSKYGYLLAPELTQNSMRKTLIGTRVQVEKMLSRLEKAGMPFEIVSASEARFTPDSLFMSLTASQRKTVAEAYSSGYFDVPRKTDSKKLARSLGISKSTLSEHLRKAEKHLLAQILS